MAEAHPTVADLMTSSRYALAHQVRDVLDELDRERGRTKAAEDALLDLTPQGSEFFRRNSDRSAEREFIVDVPACVAYVRGRLDRMRESVVAARREVRRLRWPEGGSNPIEDETPVAVIRDADLPAVGSFYG